ncbi:MAG TPA: DHHA1 domain-containing protein [Vicinamibacteria bacterium]|nr:DHHA1 domain-containing protein [Vicinamibacteria bacterium]
MDSTVLYHSHCADGFGAAWAAWKKLGSSAVYIPVKHGTDPPEIPDEHTVYILDFSYPRAVTTAMHSRFRELVVIDHHRTAEVELAGLDCALFDNEKSAAVLAWEYFHPQKTVPELLRYVMDRDLWRYELPRSREVFAGLSSYPMDFEIWSSLDIETLAQDGVAILRYQKELVKLLCDEFRWEDLAGNRVPVVNATILGSDVGEELLARHRDAPFVVIYFDRGDGKRQWSLRSRKDFDVSELARRFRNGGHRQAAGFESELPADFMPRPKR